ncbi:MAG: MipA/OmpV family protein [Aliivibrio sp.]|nr:MipA/OmpV family protein [Aliivibrio sp.]
MTLSLGYSYNSDRLNNHLYGVSAEESARSNGAISEFDADWDGQFFVGISTYFNRYYMDRLNVLIRGACGCFHE